MRKQLSAASLRAVAIVGTFGARCWGLIAAFVFLLPGSFLTALSQETGAISGTIIGSWDGQPLPGVAVTVQGTTLATTTDAQGRFQLRDVAPGVRVVRFSRSGFASASVTDVAVIAGQVTRVDGVLRPEFYEMEG